MPIDPHIAASVRDIVGAENFLDHPAETQSYGFNSYPAFTEPGAVVMLRDVEQVQRVVAMLYDRDVPMVIRGSGTNVCGSALTAKGGVVLSLERMTRILELDTVSRFAVVEAGASVDQLQKLAIENGLLFTPNPGNVAAVTVGGIIGCNSSGDLALSYGTTRDFVLGLDLVIHDGSLIRLGARCRKDVTGYDLVRLVVGSEGTLGVVTQATLKLVDKPEAETSVLVGYDEEQVGAEACLALLEERLSPVALEFMDNQTLRAVEAAFKIGIPDRAKAVVLARFFGTREATAAAARRAEAVLVRAGGFYSTTTAPGESAEHLWRARHWAYPALARICPTLYGEDICVPVRHFPAALRRIYEIAAEVGIHIACFAHAGDGQLHPLLLTDDSDPVQKERADRFVEGVIDMALEYGGSITGEHGIGVHKSRYVKRQLDTPALELTARVKKAFDPKGLFNPMIFPNVGPVPEPQNVRRLAVYTL